MSEAGEGDVRKKPHAIKRRSVIAVCLAGAVVGMGVGLGIGAGVWSGTSAAENVYRLTPPHQAGPLSKSPKTSDVVRGGKLYVVDGKSGYTTAGPNGTWNVTFEQADSVLWFADRPARASGSMTARQLASNWKTLFLGSPPNGAMLAPSGPSGHHPTAGQITNPHYSSASNSFSVTLTPDKGETSADAAWLGKLTRSTAARNGRLILFLDPSDYTVSFYVISTTDAPIQFNTDNADSQCAVAGSITDTGQKTWGHEMYLGSAEIIDTGSCYFEKSEAYWNVQYIGGGGLSGGGTLEVPFQLNSTAGSFDCATGAYCQDAPSFLDPPGLNGPFFMFDGLD
jgi:hypothetical protein